MHAPEPPTTDERFTLRLLERFAQDAQAGPLAPLEHYLAAFPQHTATVTAEWNAWQAEQAQDATTLGPYRLERLLGRGGQGTVYQALDTRLERRVALKVLAAPAWTGTTEGPPRLLAREVEALTRLDDPRIAGVLEAGVIDGQAFIATRLVQGPSLRQKLAQWSARGGPALDVRLALGLALAQALGGAHARGVVHRDIKPANVLIDEREPAALRPVLIDFGLARAVDTDLTGAHGNTRTGDQLGTPRYMAPERLIGRGQDDPRADVWALGVLLFELVTYRAPFDGQTFETVARRIEREAMPRLATTTGFARKRDLEALLERALEKAPARRYADANALATDLEHLLAGRPISARPLSALGRADRWARRHPAQATIALLLVLIAGGSTWTAWRLDRAQADERAALNQANANLARAEADRGHLLLEAGAPHRFALAREHLDAAATANQRAPDSAALDRVALRSDLMRALTGTNLSAQPTVGAGGLGVVKLDPHASLAATHALAVDTGQLELKLLALDGHPSAARGAALPLPAQASFQDTDLLAVHAEFIAVVERAGLRMVALADGASHRFPPKDGPGHAPLHKHATFDPTGRFLFAGEARAWRMYRTSDGAALSEGTAEAPLDKLAAFSADGRWLVVRHDAHTVFVLDEGRAPIRLSWNDPVIQAVPFAGEVPALVYLLAKPSGLELGTWHAPTAPGQAPTSRKLTTLAGASEPVPQLALHPHFIAAATAQELVVVERATGRVAVRAQLPSASALETLTWHGTGADLSALTLYLHQRGDALAKFGFGRVLEWMTPVAARPEPPPSAQLQLQRTNPDAAPESLTAAAFRFGSDAPLELCVPGQLLASPTATAGRSSVQPPGDGPALGAALTTIIAANAIRHDVHVWQRGTPAPHLVVPLASDLGQGAVALSPDGRLLATVLDEGRLLLHDVERRTALLDVPLDLELTRRVRALSFSADPTDAALYLETPLVTWRFDLAAVQAALAARGLGWFD